jgi:predicted DNA-binding transcriptional regulator AlpA
MPRKYDSATLVPDQYEPRRMMSEKQILDLLPIARSTLQKWEKDGKFPR